MIFGLFYICKLYLFRVLAGNYFFLYLKIISSYHYIASNSVIIYCLYNRFAMNINGCLKDNVYCCFILIFYVSVLNHINNFKYKDLYFIMLYKYFLQVVFLIGLYRIY
ncbi:hypothetical protein NUSPORA_02036 [Nucleospora cyclopteri]